MAHNLHYVIFFTPPTPTPTSYNDTHVYIYIVICVNNLLKNAKCHFDVNKVSILFSNLDRCSKSLLISSLCSTLFIYCSLVLFRRISIRFISSRWVFMYHASGAIIKVIIRFHIKKGSITTINSCHVLYGIP